MQAATFLARVGERCTKVSLDGENRVMKAGPCMAFLGSTTVAKVGPLVPYALSPM